EHEGHVSDHGLPFPEQNECPTQYAWCVDAAQDYQRDRWH
ncbi:hypothetical protein A2U01_0116268, partial [Trifolium medium]|nr:hypothetical protein [Trifolium medium]